MSTTPVPARPDRILKQLAQVWTSLGKEEKEQGKPTVLRACAMTLIVTTEDGDQDSFESSQTLTELMHEHPSRAIVVRKQPGTTGTLEAQVLAQCWMPFGKAQQICCEQIEITASGDRWEQVAPTVLGLTAPDLPVVLWCRQRSQVEQGGDPGFEQLLGLATKVIVDTAGLDVARSLANLAQWKRKVGLIGDLEWTRLTSWREPLANLFDDAAPREQLRAASAVEVEYRGDRLPASAAYMAAWLASGVQAPLKVVATEQGFGRGLQRVSIQTASGGIELKRIGPSCLQLRAGKTEQNSSAREQSAYALMHEELSVLGPDPVFDASFAAAPAYLGQQ